MEDLLHSYLLVFSPFLNTSFLEQWIGLGEPQAWPPGVPDLNLINFFLWGHVKDMVYQGQKVQTKAETWERI
jgi:hypothetical protein